MNAHFCAFLCCQLLFHCSFNHAIWYLNTRSPWRLVHIVLLAGTTLFGQISLGKGCTNCAVTAIVFPLLWVQFLNAWDLLLLSLANNIDLMSRRDSGESILATTLVERIRNSPSYRLLWNWRRIGTRWQVRTAQNSSEATSKREFLHQRLFVAVTLYLLMDILTSQPLPPKDLTAQRKEGIFGRLSELTVQEVLIRVALVSASGFTGAVQITMMHSILAFVDVASGVGRLSDYPPLFGDLRDAYSLRLFWGSVWHQGLRSSLSSIASFITYSVLRIRRDTSSFSSPILIFAFLASGLIHVNSDIGFGVPWAESGSLWFYTVQPLGLFVEEWVIQTYRAQSWKLPGHVERVFGYAWVFAFLSWSGASWAYPPMRYLNQERDRVLPFSFITAIIQRKDLA